MKTYLYYFLTCFALIGMIASQSCIDPIDFTGPEPELTLVVSGIITNSPGQRIVNLSYMDPVDIFQIQDSTPLPATVSLFEDGSLAAQFDQTGLTEYELDEDMVIREGRSYHIEIQFPAGDRYVSNPELVQPASSPDSISLGFERRRVDGGNGTTLNRWVMDLLVHNTLSPTDNEIYYRWEVDEDWEVVELPMEDNPFDVQRTCYFHTPAKRLPVTILDATELQAGKVTKRLLERQPGNPFKDRHVFNVYQHRITPQAYTFYDRLDLLVNRSGNLFDQLPAAVPGNVYNPTTPDERVLGYVEFSLSDTTRLWVKRSDIPFSLSLTCSDPNDAPDFCFECILIFGASYDKPYYW